MGGHRRGPSPHSESTSNPGMAARHIATHFASCGAIEFMSESVLPIC
jgi:hypothetical protein